MAPFAYIGNALTGQEFAEYVRAYDFGSVPPSFLVIHNTYKPDASWAPISTNPATWWDRNEAGMAAEQIKQKRKPQLDSIMVYYRDTKHWVTGPHLFVDEKWIWLFTPMYDVGTHAASGNSYHDSAGKLHYSIGIETVGYFKQHGWPDSMQKLLQIAVQSLRDRLGNFEIAYHSAPLNRPDLHDYQISMHSDYNKPSCPGDVITSEYMIKVLSTPYAPSRYQVGPYGAIAQQDRNPDALAAKQYAPGEVFEADDRTNGYVHDNTGIGFVPLGQIAKI